MSDCKKAIENSGSASDAVKLLLKSGVPCVQFADPEEQEKFLAKYPDVYQIIENLIEEVYQLKINAEKDNQQERILCSAIKRITPRPETQLRNNDIHLIEIGYRHCDIFHRFRGEMSRDPDDQGFYTSKGRFVDRKEAYLIAQKAGQIINPNPQTGCLYSEDLY